MLKTVPGAERSSQDILCFSIIQTYRLIAGVIKTMLKFLITHAYECKDKITTPKGKSQENRTEYRITL